MKNWRFYLYLSFGLLAAAGITALITFIGIGGAEGFWFTAVFMVMTVHSMIYSVWQLRKHPNKVAVFRK